MYLIGMMVWLTVSGFLAWHIARLLIGWSRWKACHWLRRGVAVLLLPLIFMGPLADEIVGKAQFDRLCEGAKEVKVYGTIPVGEKLYTPEGKWRLDMTGSDGDMGGLVESHFRWDHGGHPPSIVPSVAIPIYRWDTKLYEKTSNRLLAEWQVYSTSGGWLSQSFETPVLVRSRCDPPLAKGWGVHKQILSFDKSIQ